MMGRADIASRIPHAGRMILLDDVVCWNSVQITCRTMTHRDACNPLRQDGRLDPLCGIEYAGQAMALHGSLTGPANTPPRQGFLASVREVVWTTERLDTLGELLVTAELLHSEAGRVLYAFTLNSGGQVVLSGRAAVVLMEAAA